MWGGYNSQSMQREYQSDLWIQRNIPGGLNSAMGQRLDNYLGGNPNPTAGQIYGGYPNRGYGTGYGYHYGRW